MSGSSQQDGQGCKRRHLCISGPGMPAVPTSHQLSPPTPAVPGYLRVEGMARVRPPAQLLGAHPLALHRSVVCEAVKDRRGGQGKGMDATQTRWAPTQVWLGGTAPPGRTREGQVTLHGLETSPSQFMLSTPTAMAAEAHFPPW